MPPLVLVLPTHKTRTWPCFLRWGSAARLRRWPSNLHLHGLHISPEADAPFLNLEPREEHVYEFDVPVGSAGTYWYHPHPHGLVEKQLGAGLAGALIVEGPSDSLPGITEAEERLLVLNDTSALRGSPVLANGAHQPILEAKAGSLRLRMVNASTERYLRLALEGHPFHLIATDGGLIEEPVELEEILLAPGERAEVLVRFEREGEFHLMDLLPSGPRIDSENAAVALARPRSLCSWPQRARRPKQHRRRRTLLGRPDGQHAAGRTGPGFRRKTGGGHVRPADQSGCTAGPYRPGGPI